MAGIIRCDMVYRVRLHYHVSQVLSGVICIIIMCDSYDHLWLVLPGVTWHIVCDFIIVNFLNSEWFRRFIASYNRTTCPPRKFAREVNKSHVAVSTYPNIVTGENR